MRTRLKAWLIGAAIIVLPLSTTYLVWPELALARGLGYQSFTDGGAFVADFSETYLSCGNFLDQMQRYLIVFVGDYSESDQALALIDTNHERVVASIRPTEHTDRLRKMVLPCHRLSVCPAEVTSDQILTVEFAGYVELPTWWPLRGRWCDDGLYRGSVIAQFDCRTRRWQDCAEPRDAAPVHDPAKRAVLTYSLQVPETGFELVMEKEWFEHSEVTGFHFARLLLKSSSSQELRWELGPDAFELDASQQMRYSLRLPSLGLPPGCDWCLVERWHDEMRLGDVPVRVSDWWQLNLQSATVHHLETPRFAEAAQVASDGQTLVWKDDQNSLVAWHPELGSRALTEPNDRYVAWAALRRHRVLRMLVRDTRPLIEILPIDGAPARRVYP